MQCILQSMFWKCCSDPSIVMLKHLPLRRNCFHSQHSHRTQRVGSVRCRGNIGSSGPHKDQPSRSWVGLLRVSKKWLGACQDNVSVINYDRLTNIRVGRMVQVIGFDLWEQEAIWRRSSYQPQVSQLSFYLIFDWSRAWPLAAGS